MKILLLMPMDEQHVYAAAGIYKALDEETKAVTFAIPTFMDYLINGKLVDNWILALLDGMVTSAKLSETAERCGDNLLIIGNAPRDIEFDAVFNFQEIEEDLPYQDKFLEKVREIITANLNEDNGAEVKKIMDILNDVHEGTESRMSMHNCKATGEFLSAYMKTDIDLEGIKQKYKGKIREELLNGNNVNTEDKTE